MRVRRLSNEERKVIISKLLPGTSIKSIVLSYERRRETVCRQTIWRLLKHYHTHHTILPLPRSGRPTKLTREVLEVIDRTMEIDDETAKEIQIKLQGMGKVLSKRTILTGRKHLARLDISWNSLLPAYTRCQQTKTSGLGCGAHRNDDFHDVIWSDETTVQLESHRRFCCHKRTKASLQTSTQISY